MKISKDSWHYRLFCRANVMPSSSLCIYFWQAVFLLTQNILLAIAGLFIVSIGLSPLALLFDVDVPANVVSTSILFWIAILICVAVVVVPETVRKSLMLIGRAKNKVRVYAMPDEKPKEPSLVTEWLKAKKDKVCPVIEFKD